MPIDRFCHPIEGMRRQHIVMIEQGNKFPHRHIEAVLRRCNNATVSGAMSNANT
jgi:hypothetical protein